MTLLVDHNSTRISNRLLVVHSMKNTLGFLMMMMRDDDVISFVRRSNNNEEIIIIYLMVFKR